jgi:hypothetical protein
MPATARHRRTASAPVATALRLLLMFVILMATMGAASPRPLADSVANPTGVSATDGTDTTVHITWNGVCSPWIKSYKVVFDFDPGLEEMFLAGNVPAPTCQPTYTLEYMPDWPYRVHYFTVVSCPAEGGACLYGEPFDVDAGHSMVFLSQVDASDGAYSDRVRVSFTGEPGESRYEAWRADDPDGTYSKVGQTTAGATYYDNTTVSSGTHYYYKGKWCNSYGCSALSFFPDEGWSSPTPPAINISASDGDFGYVEVAWDAVPDALYYRVYQTQTDTPPGINDYIFNNISALHVYDYSGDPYTPYYYWVTAFITSWGSPTFYDTGWREYSAPHNLLASDGTYTDKVALSWLSDDTVSFYKVYRSTTSGGDKFYLGSPTATSFDDSSATPGVTYYYWIQACDSTFCSDFSSYNTGWQAWPVPSAVVASDGTFFQKTQVAWDSVPGATGYQIYRCSGTTTGTCGAAIASPASSPYEDDGGMRAVTYYYRVKACAGVSNCSAFSAYDAGWFSYFGLYLPLGMR